MGYRGLHSFHGFRNTATTLLGELGFPEKVVNLQLHHKEGDQVWAAYDRSRFLTQRRQMMQAWADYLDDLREGTVS